jgi:hypothetical protein
MFCVTIEDRWWVTLDHIGIAVSDLRVSESDVEVVGDRGERIAVARKVFETGMREIETDRERARNAIRSLPFLSQIRAIGRFAGRIS